MNYRQPSRFLDVIKTVRNQLRPYGGVSIVGQCLVELWAGHKKARVDELRAAPSLTLLIVKVVLEDVRIAMYDAPPCPPQTLLKCRQLLWETAPDDDLSSRGNTWMMLRALIYPQLGFQQPLDWTFLRWPAIIAALPQTSPSRHLFERAMGMAPETFGALAWIAYVPALNGEDLLPRAHFELARQLFESAPSRFLDMFAATPEQLRERLSRELRGRTDAKQPARRQQERNEFPWLSRFPLLDLGRNGYAVWHPRVLARGMEDAPHRLMATFGEEYTQAFSKEFEKYVVSLMTEIGLEPITDREFKKLGQKSFHAVDALLPSTTANVFVESKMSIFDDEVIIGDRTGTIYKKLRRVREAVVQAWQVGSLLRDGSVVIDQCARAKEDFLLVVTSRQLYCSGGEKLGRLLGDKIFEQMTEGPGGRPTPEQLQRLPPKNIIVLSISEFEHLLGCMASGLIELVPFLREVALASADPSQMRMFIDQYLEAKKPTSWWVPRIQLELRNAIEAGFESLKDEQ